MDQNLRDLFERALDAEPAPPPGDLARTAMAQGTRLRRRSTLIVGGGAAGFAAVIATVLALNLTGPPDETAPRVAAAAMAPASAGCTAAVRKSADDVSLFLLQGATGHQLDDLGAALESSPLVRSFTFESREQAYEGFKVQWRDNPDLVKAVNASQFPRAFHVELKNPATYMTFVAEFKKQPGVDQIVGSSCPTPRATSGEGE